MLVDITRQDEHVKHTETQSIRDRNTTRGVLIQQLANLSALLTGSARRVVHGEIGCSKWKKTLAYLGAAWIAGQDRSMWRTLRPSAE